MYGWTGLLGRRALSGASPALKRGFSSFQESGDNPGFALKTAVFSAGAGLLFATSVLIADWEFQLHNWESIKFNTPTGSTTLDSRIGLEKDEVTDYPTEANDMSWVYVGGARKPGFHGLLGDSGETENSLRREIPLATYSIAHCCIAMEDADDTNRVSLIGRQSQEAPLSTLTSALEAGAEQLIDPKPDVTVGEVVRAKLKTVITDEKPFMSPGTSYDVTIVKDVKIPREMVEKTLAQAEQVLTPYMSFVRDNCISTKSYTLLQLMLELDKWSQNGASDAPSKQHCDSAIVGLYQIILGDIQSYGYGVLNNPIVMAKEKEVAQMIESRGIRKHNHPQPKPMKTDEEKSELSVRKYTPF